MEAENTRFQGFANLVGPDAFEAVRNASVCVVGLGGVGSWTVEALARSGVGKLTLVDLDEVCVTNINRQLQALDDAIGKPKATLLAERVKLINPDCQVQVILKFFSASTVDEIFSQHFDVVVDAIDRVTNKTLLLASAVERKIPIVTTGSAGNRLDPSGIKIGDLAFSEYDRLLSYVRKRLRQKFSFPRFKNKAFGIPCVYLPLDGEERERNDHCTANGIGDSTARSCNAGLGTAAFVTGAMGFHAAAETIKLLLILSSRAKARDPG